MSDVVRSYSSGAKPRRRPRRRRRVTLLALLALVCFALFWCAYVTRDTHRIPALVPAAQTYQVYLNDALNKRAPLLNSSVWALLPEDSPYAALRQRFASELPLPEWIANNLLYGVCLLSGQDLTTFSDAIFVTKMSRVGCLIEQFRFVFDDIGHDHAGGLELSVLPGGAGFYAVRGRVLVASASRQALIRALTLTDQDALPETEFARGVAGAMERDVFATLHPRVQDPMGDTFDAIDVTLQVRPDGLALAAVGSLREDARTRLAPVLGPMTEGHASAPAGGLLTVALDAGQPLPDLLAKLDTLLSKDRETSLVEPVVRLLGAPTESAPPLARLLPAFAQTITGPGWVQWQGATLNAMLPLPVLLGAFEADEVAVTETMAAFATMPTDAEIDPYYIPRYDETQGVVHVPLIGGPEIEPTVGYRNGRLCLSNSRPVLEAMLADDARPEAPAASANILLRLQPAPACECVAAIGQQIADAGMLRGFSADAFRTYAADRCRQAAKVKEISLALAHDRGQVKLRADVAMTSGAN